MVGVLLPPRRASLAPRGRHSDPPEVDILITPRWALFTVKINIVCADFDINVIDHQIVGNGNMLVP